MAPTQQLSYDDLTEGAMREKEYTITQSVYEDFLKLFGDSSPLHIHDSYARKCGFISSLMHGAILNGFISNFIGMVFPGGKSLELSVDIRFSQPVYLGDTVKLQGKIAQKLDTQQVVVLHLTFSNLTRNWTSASARVQVKMMTA